MKKALAMALGAVLVAGSAAPASAASQIDFSGYYRATYAVNGNLGYTGDENLNESFFDSRFNVDVTFQATDEVSVHWRLRGPKGERWGTNRNDATVPGGQAREITTRYVYGQVVQDWGTVRVGRLSGGLGDEFGLSTLGWAPALDDFYTFIAPFEGSGEYDSIQYANTWDNGFGLTATYSKIAAQGEGGWRVADGSDHDADRFQIQPTYQWDGGGVALNMYYMRDAQANAYTRDDDDIITGRDVPGAEDKTNAWYINPAIMHSWGAFSVHFEGMFAFGETTYKNLANGDSVDDDDAEGQGFYLDFDYNYGPGRVNLAGWWVSGNDIDDQLDNDPNNNNDNNALADIQNGNFFPLVVAYAPVNAYINGPSQDSSRNGELGAVQVANQGDTFINTNILSVGQTGIQDLRTYDAETDTWSNASNGTLTDDVFEVLGADGFSTINFRHQGIDSNGGANHWALMISGQHAFTDEITFNYALAYLALVNPNYSAVDSITVRNDDVTGIGYHTQDKDLGWEIDLGVNVQLLDNLAFTSTVGYMFTGDAYQQMKGYRVTGQNTNDYSVQAEWEDADDAYTWVNSLTFSF